MKIENWNGYQIRFVEHEGEWWAVAVDVLKPLNYANSRDVLKKLDPENRIKYTIVSNYGNKTGINQEVTLISEYGIYDLIFGSKKPEAKSFKKWVYEIIRKLRQASGLEGFEIFRMLDKEHQREAMDRLHNGLNTPVKVDYIKANGIANKAVSNIYGYPKMVKKNDMPEEWLPKRQIILDDTVELMTANDKFGLGLSVSKTIYGKYKTG